MRNEQNDEQLVKGLHDDAKKVLAILRHEPDRSFRLLELAHLLDINPMRVTFLIAELSRCSYLKATTIRENSKTVLLVAIR